MNDRAASPFTTTTALADLVERIVHRRGGTHPATRVFQALRIAVNRELEHLEHFLAHVLEWLLPAGAPGRDRLPLARGPDGEAGHALVARALHLSAGAAALRVRRARAGADPDRQGRHADARKRSTTNRRARSARLRACEVLA